MRTLYSLLFVFLFLVCPAAKAQDGSNSFMTQAQSSLEKKEYTKARYLFIQAYKAFADNGDYEQAIEAGTRASFLYYRENYYQEAFELCRKMDQFIFTEEQKRHQSFYEQRFLIAKERLGMYLKLKNMPQAQKQLGILENWANQANSETTANDLAYSQTEFYYSFGQDEKGDAALGELIGRYQEKKEFDKADDCFRNLIDIARRNNNTTLMGHIYDKYIVWNDSIKALATEEKLNASSQRYEQSLRTIEEKDKDIARKQYWIGGLVIFSALLIAALAFLGFLLLRFIMRGKKLEHVIQTLNEHNERHTRFVQSMSAQMEPTLNIIDESAQRLKAKASEEAEAISLRIEALRRFAGHIQELSSLENTLATPYETTTFNVGKLCEKIMGEIEKEIHPEVKLVTDVPRLEIKSNPEYVEKILSHLLRNAAFHTSSGNIKLEFKRKGAHVCQFIVTDNGTGIPEERKENLFTPFNKPQDLASGDGMGLPIRALMANKLNGTLSIDKEYKKGCRFILSLQI